MKKALLLLTLVFSTAAISAQSLPSVKSSDLTNAVTEAAPQLSSKQESKIKSALMEDKDIQSQTIDFLKSNPDTASSLMGLAKANKGNNKGLMKSILGDKSLTQAAVDYISKNPALLQKAMKFVGM